MERLKTLILVFLTVTYTSVSAQVKIRIFSTQTPESVVFSVTEGKYEIDTFNGAKLIVGKGEPVIIARSSGKLVVKTRVPRSPYIGA